MGTAIVCHHRPRPPGVSEHAHQEDEAALCRDPSHPAGLPAQRVAVVPAPLLGSALGNERVLSEADVEQYAAAAGMRPSA
jgi:hypothetical protein